MKTLKKFLPSTADFRPPTFLLGVQFDGIEKVHFEKIQKAIDDFMLQSGVAVNRGLLSVLDAIEDTKKIGMSKSMEVLTDIVKLIRIQLLSNDPSKVYSTVILIDGVIKNSGYRMHILIGRRRFMKTYGLVLRRHRSHVNSALHQRVSALMIDCIQAYGEAFMTRRMLYPFIYDTYYKIRNKYFIRFTRPDFDPTRVPIFLGEITAQERQLARDFPDDQSVSSANSPRTSSYLDSHDEMKESGYEGEGGQGRRGGVSASSYSDRTAMDRQTHPHDSAGGTYASPPPNASSTYRSSATRSPPQGQAQSAGRQKKLEFAEYDWETDNAAGAGRKVTSPPVKTVNLPKKAAPPKEEPSLLDFSELPVTVVASPQTVNTASFKFPTAPPPPPPPTNAAVIPPPAAVGIEAAAHAAANGELALIVPARPPPPPPVLNPRVLGSNEKATRENNLSSNPFDDLSWDVERMKMQASAAATSTDVKTTTSSSSSNNPRMLRRTRSENDHDLVNKEDSWMPERKAPAVPSTLPAPPAFVKEVVHLRPVSRKSSPLGTLPEETEDPVTGEVNEQPGGVVPPTGDTAPGAPAERTGTYYRRQQDLKRAASTSTIVSSDPNVDIRFYGNQRVVIKK